VPRNSPLPESNTLSTLLSALPKVFAALLVLTLFTRAVIDVDLSWDTWMYHMLFAARIWDLIPDGSYIMIAQHEARWEGFPMLAEALQGFLWKITGRPESTDLLALFSLIGFAFFLKSYLRISIYISLLALLAIPLVQIHTTNSYVDLFGNLGLSALIILAYLWYSNDDFASIKNIFITCIAAAVAANTKFQLLPLAAIVCAIIVIRWIQLYFTSRAKNRDLPQPVSIAMLIAVLLSPAIFFTPVKNLLQHGNPVFPVNMAVGNVKLEGPNRHFAHHKDRIEKVSEPASWLLSVMEVGSRPLTHPRRWTYDNWQPVGKEGRKRGGFFNLYVLLNLAVLIYFSLRMKSRESLLVAGTILLLSALAAFMPGSFQLRYYMFWMICLVSFNLYLIAEARFYNIKGAVVSEKTVAWICMLFVLAVIGITRAQYVLPSLYSFNTLKHYKVSQEVLDTIQDGEKVCLYNEPWTFVYASGFHGLDYVVKEGRSAGECGEFRYISVPPKVKD